MHWKHKERVEQMCSAELALIIFARRLLKRKAFICTFEKQTYLQLPGKRIKIKSTSHLENLQSKTWLRHTYLKQ